MVNSTQHYIQTLNSNSKHALNNKLLLHNVNLLYTHDIACVHKSIIHKKTQ